MPLSKTCYQRAIMKIILIIILALMLFQCHSGNKLSDSERFAIEYPLVGKNNIFVYRNADETADILTNGRGVVFMGFKECPWCQQYAVYLHEVASEMGMEKIFYLDIKEDRESNSEGYQRIVNILADFLQYDDEGRPRVYVPDVSIVSRGRKITRDFETSKETLGFDTPAEYWNEERVNALKERLRKGMDIFNQITRKPCSPC
jgi:thiol-disulfide isomerase/thioredoxin